MGVGRPGLHYNSTGDQIQLKSRQLCFFGDVMEMRWCESLGRIGKGRGGR